MDWVDQADRFWAGELGVSPHVFRTDGFHVTEHPASRHSIRSLEVRGPAYLAYWPPSSPQPTPLRQTELLDGDGRASLASLCGTAPAEWEEAGIEPDSWVFGLRVNDRIVAVDGYERWSGQIAQLQVFCHPGYRQRGLAAEPLKAAISHALADSLLPQYRARYSNAASLALAKRVGFVEYGWMATVLVRLERGLRQ